MSTRTDMTEIVLHTRRHVVRGFIALLPGARLTDYVRQADCFIAVTTAVVCNHEGRELFRAEFLDVHRDAIELAIPADLLTPPSD